jgi:hypothetical protein
MSNPLIELALEEIEANAAGNDGENAVALVSRWRASAATAEDLQVLKDYMVRIAAEVVKASGGPHGN